MDESALSSVLVGAFVEARPDAKGDELGEVLRGHFETARRRWPSVVIDPAQFAAHLALHVGDADDSARALDALHTDDLYLALACANGDAEAVARLNASMMKDAEAALRSLRLDPDVLSEARQHVAENLLVARPDRRPAIAGYSGRARLNRWIRVVAVRDAIRLARRKRREPSGDGGDVLATLADDRADPEIALLKAKYKRCYKEVFEEVLASLQPRERNLLRYHLVERLTAGQIAALYGTHRTSAGRWIAAAQAKLVDGARTAFVARLGLNATQLPSLMGLIHSQMTLSLDRVLPPAATDDADAAAVEPDPVG